MDISESAHKDSTPANHRGVFLYLHTTSTWKSDFQVERVLK